MLFKIHNFDLIEKKIIIIFFIALLFFFFNKLFYIKIFFIIGEIFLSTVQFFMIYLCIKKIFK